MWEKSCGAVVVTEKDGLRYYALVKGSYIGLPKGHMESGESERETALENPGGNLCNGKISAGISKDRGISTAKR